MQEQNSKSDAIGVSQGFPPIAAADARVLILGSLPSQASLDAQEYYAHPRNAFWILMKTIAGADGDYAARCEALKAHGIAVHAKALELGGTDEGAPGPRGEQFYAGYFRDLDGNKLNAFCMSRG